MKLLYQNPDGRWDDISVDLKSTSYSDRLLSHAALVATQNGILVATYSVCQKIRFYRVQINWNPPQWDPAQQPKQTPPQFPVPSFRFTHSKVETSCTVPGMHRNDGEEPDMMHQSISNPLYTLSRLDIILPASDNAAGTTANPWIVAVFSTPPQATPDHPGPQGPASVIVRWQLDTAAFTLHPKFDEMAAKRNSTQIKVDEGPPMPQTDRADYLNSLGLCCVDWKTSILTDMSYPWTKSSTAMWLPSLTMIAPCLSMTRKPWHCSMVLMMRIR